jgi:hypothetical protein
MVKTQRARPLCGAALGAAIALLLIGGPAAASTGSSTGHSAAFGRQQAHGSPTAPAKPARVVPRDAVDPATGPRIVPKPAVTFSGISPLATTWTVRLATSNTTLSTTQYAQLTATANQNVGTTNNFLVIYDTTTAQYIAICGTGTTCTASVTAATAAADSYVAAVSLKPVPPTFPPTGVRATSTPVTVTWTGFTVSLSATPTTVAVGATATVTATTDADVGTSPFYTEIYDAVSGALVAACSTGTTCSGTETEPTATTDSYVAYVANYSSTGPPVSVQGQSTVSYVTWSDDGFDVALAATAGSATATATVPAVPGPYTVEIFDETAGGTLLTSCDSVVACTTTTTPGDQLVAFVSAPVADLTLPPVNAEASSAVVAAV